MKKHPKQFKILMALMLVIIATVLYRMNASNLVPLALVFIMGLSLALVALVLKLFKKSSLPTKIILGLLLGTAAGFFFREQAVLLKPLGTIFIRLISLVVVPLVFVSLFLGTASIGDIKKLGKIGAKTLLYYLTTTLIAIIIGLALVTAIKPGEDAGLGVSAQDLAFKQPDTEISFIDNLVNIIPANPVQALVEGNMLQVIFLALLFGVSVTTLARRKRRILIDWFESVNETIFTIIHMIMKMAPFGVFALIAASIGSFGFDVLFSLMKYGLLVIIGLTLHAVVIISVFVRLVGKIHPIRFWKAIRPAMVLAFSTSSSNATLPVTMESVEKGLSVPRLVSSFVLPLGATINMDGTALYQCVSIFFIAQVYGVEISLVKMMIVVLSVVLASIGTAGAPMAGVLILVMILRSIGVPTEGIAMIMGIERLMDMARTTVNIVGDASATVVITQLERKNLALKT